MRPGRCALGAGGARLAAGGVVARDRRPRGAAASTARGAVRRAGDGTITRRRPGPRRGAPHRAAARRASPARRASARSSSSTTSRTDATAAVARAGGATVVAGRPLPAGWVGKAWALQQGLDAATGEWVVLPRRRHPPVAAPPPLARRPVRRRRPRPAHRRRALRVPDGRAALAAPGDADDARVPQRAAGSTRPGPAAPRGSATGSAWGRAPRTLHAAGGFAAVAGHAVEDVALVRALAGAGRRRRLPRRRRPADGADVRDAGEAWRGWGRSLALPGVDPRARRLARPGGGRARAGPAAVRLLGAPRRCPRRRAAGAAGRHAGRHGPGVPTRGVAYWLSPPADVVAVAALVRSTRRRRHAPGAGGSPRPPSRSAGRRAT